MDSTYDMDTVGAVAQVVLLCVIWVVVNVALVLDMVPVSTCRVALGFLWPTLAYLDVVL